MPLPASAPASVPVPGLACTWPAPLIALHCLAPYWDRAWTMLGEGRRSGPGLQKLRLRSLPGMPLNGRIAFIGQTSGVPPSSKLAFAKCRRAELWEPGVLPRLRTGASRGMRADARKEDRASLAGEDGRRRNATLRAPAREGPPIPPLDSGGHSGKGLLLGRAILYTFHHPEGVVYRSFCLNSSTFAASEIVSRRWWCIGSLFPSPLRDALPRRPPAREDPGGGQGPDRPHALQEDDAAGSAGPRPRRRTRPSIGEAFPWPGTRGLRFTPDRSGHEQMLGQDMQVLGSHFGRGTRRVNSHPTVR